MPDWLLDMECQLVELFHWSLAEIDATDMESLITFIFHYPRWQASSKTQGAPRQKQFVDQVDWL